MNQHFCEAIDFRWRQNDPQSTQELADAVDGDDADVGNVVVEEIQNNRDLSFLENINNMIFITNYHLKSQRLQKK